MELSESELPMWEAIVGGIVNGIVSAGLASGFLLWLNWHNQRVKIEVECGIGHGAYAGNSYLVRVYNNSQSAIYLNGHIEEDKKVIEPLWGEGCTKQTLHIMPGTSGYFELGPLDSNKFHGKTVEFVIKHQGKEIYRTTQKVEWTE